MRLVIEVIVIKIESNPVLKTRYRNGLRNIRELVEICEMRLVIEVIVIKIESNPVLKTRYRNGLRNIRELVEIFQEVQDVFALAKRRFDQIDQLCWQIFISDAHLLKYKVPLNPNINNITPQNCNIQEDNIQTNQTDKPNTNTNIQGSNPRVETCQYKDQSNNGNYHKRQSKSSSMSNIINNIKM